MKNIHRSFLAITALSLVAAGCQDANLPTGSENISQANISQDNLLRPSTQETANFSDIEQGTVIAAAGGKNIQDQYIVIFNDDVADVDTESEKVTKRHGGQPKAKYRHALKGFTAKMNAQQAEKMAKDPKIKFIEQDQQATISDGGQAQGATIQAQSIPWGVQKMGGTGNGTGKLAWIVDTGIDLYHPDLNVDIALSRNFVAGESSPQDLNGHGTHVAGIIGAKNNYDGVVGIAANARVAAVRVLNASGSGAYSDIIAGIDYVTSRAAAGQVANLSLGGGTSSAIDYAVTRLANKGVYVIIAAGNSSANSANVSPARVNHSYVYTVSAVDQNNYFASFSNYGNPPIDCAAPGVNILSTYPGNRYATMSGTSMAAPHVAGAILMGSLRGYGYAINDPDGRADVIAHR